MTVAPSENALHQKHQAQQQQSATTTPAAQNAQRQSRLRTNTAAWSDVSPGNIDHLMLAIFKSMQADIAQRRYGLQQTKKSR